MRTHSTHRRLPTALALLLCLAPAPLAAQASGTRRAPPPVPTVTRPSEGQVVNGDLEIAVAVQEGSVARRYAMEAAYWDAGRGTWVYPGSLGAEFGSSAAATTRIGSDIRTRLNAAATRWRIRVHSTDPPGGWGPWREFTWQGTPGQASAGGANQAVAKAAPTPAAPPEDAAVLLAEIDKEIAASKKQIAVLKLKISQEKQKIDSLEADYVEADALLKATAQKEVGPRDSLKWALTIMSLKQRMDNDQLAIKASHLSIEMYLQQIKKIEEYIHELEKQRAKLLA